MVMKWYCSCNKCTLETVCLFEPGIPCDKIGDRCILNWKPHLVVSTERSGPPVIFTSVLSFPFSTKHLVSSCDWYFKRVQKKKWWLTNILNSNLFQFWTKHLFTLFLNLSVMCFHKKWCPAFLRFWQSILWFWPKPSRFKSEALTFWATLLRFQRKPLKFSPKLR